MFYRSTGTFGAVASSAVFVSEIEVVSATSFFQRGGVVEKHGVAYVLIFAEFSEADFRESVRSRRFELRME